MATHTWVPVAPKRCGYHTPMPLLRSSTFLARLVLAWFALAVSAAAMSPVIQPKSTQLVCTSAGAIKLVVTDAGDQDASAAHPTLDCSLCLNVLAPASWAWGPLPSPKPATFLAQPASSAPRAVAVAGAPLPPRGPPSAATSLS